MPVLTKINTNVIADDAITGDKFAGDTYLENTSNQNLTGTYAESRLYTSDAYTLTGDTTVNANLVLSSVKGDDSDITLTADSTTRTLTGTGVLSGGGTLQGRKTLTGMSGELGSVVTGTLGSGVTGGSGITLSGPVGMIASFAMDVAPTGWIICNGAAVSRTTTYDALFAVIATTWGVGDGSSTFNLPDLQGAFLRGVGTSTAFTQDSAVTLAGVQSDQFQSHKLKLQSGDGTQPWGTITSGSGSYRSVDHDGTNFGDWLYAEGFVTQGANGTPRVGTETRPNNIGVTFCIKY